MKNADKPAYPDNWDAKLPGLTKREYFAGLAMQGLLANNDLADVEASHMAIWAVMQADALLKELEK